MPAAARASREGSGGRRLRAPKRLLAALPDERLANRLGQGDEGAFELLYDRHHRGLLGFCRHMLRSHHEAEDAVQQAFIAAYRAIAEKGDRPTRVKPWLYAIGRNCCLAMIRGQREAGPPLSEDAGTSASRTPEHAEQRAELRALLEDVGRLPEAQRSALVLAELGGLGHRDVAEVLECRPDKVRALVFQARSALLDQREARGASCQEVRSRLANMSGSRLHGITRRHVKSCPGCAGFYENVRRQRRVLALVLPIAPSVGLKENVLAAATGGAASGGASGAGLGAGAALNTGTLGGTATGGGGAVAGAAAGGGTAAGTTGGGGAAAATAGGATVAGSAAGGGAAAGAGGAAAGAGGAAAGAGGAAAGAGGAAAGATAGGAFAGGGVLAAITAHAGLTKATAVALAAGSVAVGAEVAKKTDHAEPAGERARSADARGGGTGAPGRSERRDSPASDSNSKRSKSSRPERASRGRDPSDESIGNRHTARRSSRSSEPGAAGSTPSPASSGGSSSHATPASAGGEARPSGGSPAAGAPPQRTSSSGSGGSSSRGGGSQRSTSDQSGGSPLESTRRAVTNGEKPSKQVRSVTDGASQKAETLKHRP